MFLERGKTVGNGSQARTLYIRGVVASSTAVVVAALLNAVVDIKTEEGGRSIKREHALDVVVDRELQIDKIFHLSVPCVVKLLEGFELPGIARFQTKSLACLGVNAVVQGYLQNLRRVQIARQQIGLLAKGSHLNTPRAASLASILQRLAGTDHLLDISVWVENAGIAVPLSDDLQARHQELVRRILGNMDT